VNAQRLRQLLIAASILGYALLEHYSNGTVAPKDLGATLAVLPPLAAVLLMARRARWPWLALPLVLIAAATVLLRYWRDIQQDFGLIYLLQQCGVYLMLAAAFGRSLLPGQVPLCNRWATMLHGALPAPAVRYTRAVTAAWTAFFAAIVLLSAALYATAPRSIWSLFSNFLILPLAALMFAGEYALRRRRLPMMRRISLGDTMRVYLADTRRSPRG